MSEGKKPSGLTKLRLEIELEYDAARMHSDEKEDVAWFMSDVLGDELILHSNLIGDEVGTVKVLRVISKT